MGLLPSPPSTTNNLRGQVLVRDSFGSDNGPAGLIGFRADNISFFDPDAGGQATVEYRYWRLRAGLGVGRQLGQWGEIRVGARFDRNRARPLVGDPAFQSVEEDEGEGFARFSIDLLDNSRFPTRGTLLGSEAWFAFDENLNDISKLASMLY